MCGTRGIRGTHLIWDTFYMGYVLGQRFGTMFWDNVLGHVLGQLGHVLYETSSRTTGTMFWDNVLGHVGHVGTTGIRGTRLGPLSVVLWVLK